jgi:hypothetical protein
MWKSIIENVLCIISSPHVSYIQSVNMNFPASIVIRNSEPEIRGLDLPQPSLQLCGGRHGGVKNCYEDSVSHCDREIFFGGGETMTGFEKVNFAGGSFTTQMF